MHETPETGQPGSVADTAVPATPVVTPAGELLRQAREAKGLSVAAIATQMNLDIRTIEALEQGNQDKLPAPIFVRGYLRSFARLVGASETEVLQAYQAQAPAEPVPQRVGMPTPRRRGIGIPAIPWRGLLISAVLVSLAFAAVEFGPKLLTRFMTGDQAVAPAVLPLPTPTDGADAVGNESGLDMSIDEGGGIDLALPAPDSAEGQMPLALPAPTDLAEAPNPGVPLEEPAAPAPAEPEPELIPEAEVEPTAPAADRIRIDIRFSDDSWVEIRAADGAKLMYGLISAGTLRTLEGKAPVSLLLGNAKAVELSVNGQAFDVQRHTRGKVARFTLNATQ